MLATDHARWLGVAPRWRIRGQIVSYKELCRYFRRKRISDPLRWVDEHAGDNFIASEDVELLTPESSSNSENDSPDILGTEGRIANPLWPAKEQQTSSFTPLPCPSLLQDGVPESTNAGNDIQELLGMDDFASGLIWPVEQGRLIQSGAPHMSSTPQKYTLPFCAPLYRHNNIAYPTQYQHLDTLTWSMRAYCISYLDSPRSATHNEPAVHKDTVHAIFAQHIQDGVALLLTDQGAQAFPRLDKAFTLIRPILANDNPMSLALILSLLCELDTHRFHPLTNKLCRHIRDMATTTSSSPNHPLATIFHILAHGTLETSNLVLAALRLAAAHLARFPASTPWKSLYVRERLCDALYHAGVDSERLSLRTQLLHDQEALYGPCARNTLWTLTNVADDLLRRGEGDAARRRYEEVLGRSEALVGFGKAKTRFAGLEGVARCVEVLNGGEGDEMEGLGWWGRVWEALEFYERAEEEARAWFEVGSRRTARVRVKIGQLRSVLGLGGDDVLLGQVLT